LSLDARRPSVSVEFELQEHSMRAQSDKNRLDMIRAESEQAP
jgi:hypothetical protein